MIVIKTRTLGLAAALTIFGGVALSSLLDYWSTTSTKTPATIASGEFAGLPNPADIRGSYTWSEVASAFNMPLERLLTAFGAENPADKINTLEALYEGKLPADSEIGTDSVRLFVALYLGLPHQAEGGTVLPMTAIPLLKAEGRASTERLAEASANALSIGSAPAQAEPVAIAPTAAPPAALPPAQPSPAAAKPAAASPVTPPAATQAAGSTSQAEEAPEAGTITGKTSFNDLKTWGADMKKVEEVLGGLGPSAQALRDYCSAQGLSFSEMKAKLQALLP